MRCPRRTCHRGFRHLNLQTFLGESTWGYPIISAIHVLAIAWFGGTVLLSSFDPQLRTLRRIGLALALSTGAILFWLHPGMYAHSTSFRVKMVLLGLVLIMKPSSKLAIGFWVAIIFASRGIAFW
jgi:hypothetical protein